MMLLANGTFVVPWVCLAVRALEKSIQYYHCIATSLKYVVMPIIRGTVKLGYNDSGYNENLFITIGFSKSFFFVW